MPRKKAAGGGADAPAGSKRRKLEREKKGEPSQVPAAWAPASFQKTLQTIAAYQIAGSMFTKKSLGLKVSIQCSKKLFSDPVQRDLK